MELLEQSTLTILSSASEPNLVEGNATRVFLGPSGVPSVGSVYYDALEDITYNNIVASSITQAPYERNDTDNGWIKKYTINYIPRESFELTNSTPREVDSESWDGGASIISIELGNNWYEANDSNTIIGSLSGGGERASTIIVTGSLTKTFVKSESQKNAFLSSYFGKAGKINNSTTYNFGAGNLMLGPISGSNRLNSDGNIEYVFDVTYNYRLIPTKATDGWLYIVSPTSGNWIKPVVSTNGTSISRYLYEKGDITLS